MTDAKLEMLKNANLPEEWYPYCYIAEGGMIFTPKFTEGGSLLKTGEQVYNEDYLNPPAPPKSELEIMQERVELTEAALNAIMSMM